MNSNRAWWPWFSTSLGVNTAIVLFNAILIGILWNSVFGLVRSERQDTIRAAIDRNENLAIAFEQYTVRTIESADAVIQHLIREYVRSGRTMDVARLVADYTIDNKAILGVVLADERGDARTTAYTSNPVKWMNLANREHFKVHFERDSGKVFVGKPVVGRITGQWVIPITRRINKADGTFGGVAMALIEPARFTDVLRDAKLRELDVISLVGLDGHTRARLTGTSASWGQDVSKSALFSEQAKRPIGNYFANGQLDNVPRYFSYRTLPSYQMITTVGAAEVDVMAEFYRRQTRYFWTAGLTSAVIAGFAALLMLALTSQRRAAANVARSHAQFRATFNQDAIGISHTALDGRILQANQKLCDILGYSRQELLERTFQEITHPDDVAKSVVRRKLVLAGETINMGLEKRYLHKDGTAVWIAISTALVRNASGEPDYFVNLIEGITERKQLQQNLLHLAHHDSLTGLPNRELFYDRLGQALGHAHRRNWTTGVMFIDLDGFKTVNDTLGHGIGDQLLQQVSERLAQCVRADDTVGRLGGDEFAIILSELAYEQNGGLVAQKAIDALARPFQIDGNEIFITASIGITTCPTDTRNADTLVSNADAAMYNAKKLGKNNYQFYTAAMNERSMEKLLLEKDLRNAVLRNEFVLHFQPKANLHSGRITGVEALLRWQHPDGRLVPPLEFIPVLEQSGLIVPAGEWVLRAACEQLNAWQQGGVTPVPIAVNLSARQFHQQDIVAMVMRALLEYGVDPHLVELEITESAAMQDARATTATLHKLKALGVRIAIDDFGTGYSSLSYLKRFPIDSLKIDRSFVTDLPGDQEDASIAQAVITMAHALRLKVIAEGVENEAQLEFLVANGCDEMQGYYFSRPLPAELCSQFLREQRTLRTLPVNRRHRERRLEVMS